MKDRNFVTDVYQLILKANADCKYTAIDMVFHDAAMLITKRIVNKMAARIEQLEKTLARCVEKQRTIKESRP